MNADVAVNLDDLGGSVTLYIEPLKAGDEGAARSLWYRYFDSLVRLARNRLRGGSSRFVGDEDIALEVPSIASVGARPPDGSPSWLIAITGLRRRVGMHWNPLPPGPGERSCEQPNSFVPSCDEDADRNDAKSFLTGGTRQVTRIYSRDCL